MKSVRVADLPSAVSAADVFRPLTEPLGVTDFAINYYSSLCKSSHDQSHLPCD